MFGLFMLVFCDCILSFSVKKCKKLNICSPFVAVIVKGTVLNRKEVVEYASFS